MIKNLLWGICALVLVTALSYYFFIVRKRKKYYCTIWERGVGKYFQATKTDELVRKKANEGKEFYYTFKNSKIETIPPSDEQIIRKGKRVRIKDYVRRCKRCFEIYETSHRLGRICKKCKKSNGGEYMNKSQKIEQLERELKIAKLKIAKLKKELRKYKEVDSIEEEQSKETKKSTKKEGFFSSVNEKIDDINVFLVGKK
jgi:predicted RNase H-like nuclease (RuvC/YqgF family)